MVKLFIHLEKVIIINQKFNYIHLSLLKRNSKAFEITRNNIFSNIIDVFNNYEYFVSYDPLTFLTIISAMRGCVSILYAVNVIV